MINLGQSPVALDDAGAAIDGRDTFEKFRDILCHVVKASRYCKRNLHTSQLGSGAPVRWLRRSETIRTETEPFTSPSAVPAAGSRLAKGLTKSIVAFSPTR